MYLTNQPQIEERQFGNIDKKLYEQARLEIMLSTDNSRMAQILKVPRDGIPEGEYLVKTPWLDATLKTLNNILTTSTVKRLEAPMAGEKKPALISFNGSEIYNPLDQWLVNENFLVTERNGKDIVSLKLIEQIKNSKPGRTSTTTFYELQGPSFESIYNKVLNIEEDKKFYKELDKATSNTKKLCPIKNIFSKYKRIERA